MPSQSELMPRMPGPTPARPLAGLTVLVVEDSRFASEAVRLLCLRSGARIRRADSLASARRHLRVYMPNVAIVDLGLPDGSGIDLIRDMAFATPRVAVVLAISGDDTQLPAARKAGAHDVMTKPLEDLAVFQGKILAQLPPEDRVGPRALPSEQVAPDPLALYDDLAHISELIEDDAAPGMLDYIAQFLIGVGRSAEDSALEDAAVKLSQRQGPACAELAAMRRLIAARLRDRAVI